MKFALTWLLAVGLTWPYWSYGLDRTPTANPQKNYLLYCAGCHGMHAEGVAQRVPSLKNSLPIFLKTPEGREFLFSVPGVVNSQLDDAHMLDLFNDLRRSFHLVTPAFTLDEVTKGRHNPVSGVRSIRQQILMRIPDGDKAIDY